MDNIAQKSLNDYAFDALYNTYRRYGKRPTKRDRIIELGCGITMHYNVNQRFDRAYATIIGNGWKCECSLSWVDMMLYDAKQIRGLSSFDFSGDEQQLMSQMIFSKLAAA